MQPYHPSISYYPNTSIEDHIRSPQVMNEIVLKKKKVMNEITLKFIVS